MADDKTLVYTIRVESTTGEATVRKLNGQIVATKVSVSDLRKELGNFAVSTKKTTQVAASDFKKFQQSVQSSTGALIGGQNTGLKGVSAASGSADASLLEVGRTISDSNYGIRGMANNLSQLASNLIYTTKKAGGFMGGMKALGSSLVGPLGIIIAFQTVIALFERYAIKSDEAKSAAKNLKKETEGAWSGVQGSIESATLKLETYAKVYKDSTSSINAQKNALKELKSLGFDPTTTAIDDFIEKQKELIIVQATSKVFKKQLEEFVQARVDVDKKIGVLNTALSKASKTLIEKQEAEAKASELNKESQLIALRAREAAETKYNNALAKTQAYTEARGNIFLNIKDKAEEYKKTLEELLDLELGKTKDNKDKKGDWRNVDFGKYDDGDFSEPLKDFDKWYRGYSEERRAIQAEIDIVDAEIAANNILNNDEKLVAESNILDMKLKEDLARIQFEIDERTRLGFAIQDLEDEKVLASANSAKEMQAIDEKVAANKMKTLDLVGNALSAFSTLAGKETEAGKALAIAAATIDTYVGANKALTDETIPNTFARIAAVAAVIATGLANVKSIASTKVNGSSSGGGAVSSGRTFDFNLAGSTGQNQLAQTIGGQVAQPIKAYVVSSEITNQQQFDNQIQGEVTIG